MAEAQSTVMLQLAKEEQEAEQAKAEGKSVPPRAWHPNYASWSPAALYNGMIAPLTPFPIRGVIWYQGESNTGWERASSYGHLFPTLIQDWRRVWGIGDFPFLFVQIANLDTKPEDLWPDVREAQRQALALANTGMAVTIDIGEGGDIHPKNKKDVGIRLALAARAVVHGEKLEYSGPLFRQATREGDALRVWFDHIGTGLLAKGGDLKGFEVAGEDGVFKPALAQIDEENVLVSSPAVLSPRKVRYGWAANPTCNLYNREGLPASPFRSSE
jgi:sialate O-acetylesterase